MANKDLIKLLLEQGLEAWNQWRLRHLFDFAIDLTEAELEGLNLEGAMLMSTDLRWTRLKDTNLKGSSLGGADLSFADLSGANLEGANLEGANLIGTNLSYANLRGANLVFTKFVDSILIGADLSCSELAFTVFGDVDLSQTKGLGSVHHEMPSTVGLDTIYRSGGKISAAFLRGVGAPEDFIQYMKSPKWKDTQYHPCFISHSSKDEAFAAMLCRGLKVKGIRCWYFPKDAKLGKAVWGEIDSSIKT